MRQCECMFVGSFLATKISIGNLPATGRGVGHRNYYIHVCVYVGQGEEA